MRVWSLLFSLGGLGVLALGLWLHRRTRTFLRRARPARGRYVGTSTEATVDGAQATSYGAIEFRTESGQTVRFSGRVGTPFEGRKVGREVDVLYDPASPEEAVVRSFVELWFPALICLTTGIGMALAPLVLWLILGPPR